jgi:hypothetical protein
MHTSIPFKTNVVSRIRRPPVSENAAEHRRPSWITVGLGAVVIAFADGFWVISLRGAVGAVSENQNPFRGWLQSSTLMLPVVLLVILGSLKLTRRWVPSGSRLGHELAMALLLVVTFTSVISIGEVAAYSWHDYRIQAKELATMHPKTGAPMLMGLGGDQLDKSTGDQLNMSTGDAKAIPSKTESMIARSPSKCSALCAARRATRNTHLRAVGYVSVLLFATNLVLFLWILALRSGQLWTQPSKRQNLLAVRTSERAS